MPEPDRFAAYCAEQLGVLGPIALRYMFGGWCLYCDGLAIALVADGALWLKADAESRPEFAAKGLRAFQPFPDKPMTMSYYQTPAEVFEDEEALRHWAGLALAAAARQKKGKPKRAASKKGAVRNSTAKPKGGRRG